MPCYHPLRAFKCASGGVVFNELARHDTIGPIDLSCGQCIGCRLDRARAWSLRILHEASLYERNCFVTLTFNDFALPADGSLDHRTFQKFMKRLRKANAPRTIRFYMCGEYGDQLARPHFHACLFNVDFPDQTLLQKTEADSYIFESPTLAKLWPHGTHSIGKLNLQSAGYTARYILQRINGDWAENHYNGRKPEYNAMSLKPGIGSGWFDKHAGTDMLPGDYVIDSKGRKNPVPKYYDILAKRSGHDLDQTKADRELAALPHRADNTADRLLVKETVKRAATRNFTRDLK